MNNLKKQASMNTQFTRHVNYCKKIPANTTIYELQERLKNIMSMYEEFRVLQDDIETECGDDTVSDQYTLRNQVEDYYFFCVSCLQEAIDKLKLAQQPPVNNNQNNAQNNQKSDIKLPRIDIPVFSGDYKGWPEFKDLFTSLVHDKESLKPVEKFHYLKNRVSGDAANLIKSLHMTDANYPEAWKRLNDRYQHRRFIVDCHLKALFNQKAIQHEDPLAIKELIDNSTEVIRALQVLGLPVNHWDAILVHTVASKLDKETHKQWELTLKKQELPTFESLEEFLEVRWQSLEMISKSKAQIETEVQQSTSFKNLNNKGHQNSFKNANQSYRTLVTTTPRVNLCIYCNQSGHMTGYCPEYISLSYDSKNNFVKSKNLCFNCLKSGHSLKSCTNKSNCQLCGKRHHSSLHKNQQIQLINNTSDKPTQVIRSNAVTDSTSNNIRVLLAAALVNVKTSSNMFIPVRTLIDQGSENSLVQEKLANKLGLMQKPETVPIIGVGEVVAQQRTALVKVQIQSRVDPLFKIEVDMYTMKVVTGNLPSLPMERQNWPHLQGIKLADEFYERSSPIEMLLGAEVFEQIILEGIIKKQNNSPTAMNSRLGWLLFGRVQARGMTPQRIKCFNVSISDEKLNTTLQTFWELEDVPEQRKLTLKEQQAEEIFQKSITTNTDGRYQVALPFDPSKQGETLGESRISALYCLYQMEKRFQSNQLLKQRYHNYIQNLIESEHIEVVPQNRLNVPVNERFYLPHHGVTKESSLTTKLRVVFNASRKSTSGYSLNDKLLVGPVIQDDLFSIIIRWRKHSVAFIADIEKMYRQIKLTPDHRDYQRLLWRFSPEDLVAEYRITTVIDGTASATFLATRALRQVAIEVDEQFPEISEIINKDFYMDDVSSGSHNVPSAIKLQDDLIKLLGQRGFILKKWFSNKKELMENVPLENRHDQEALVELVDKSIKTLGVFWNQKQDSFEFKVASNDSTKRVTKRNVLSDTAKLFDPIGWLSPTTIVAKIFLQSLWTIKELDWDSKLPKGKFIEWQLLREQLSALESIKISRWIGTTPPVDVQFHGFADASNKAYAAVVYSRVVFTDGSIQVSLISGKTKVAPIKTISMPKLELCGCLLLSRLITKIKAALNFKSADIHLYSDSTVALAWITSHPNHWNTFVANRITDIQQLTEVQSWNYVETNQNPADCATRGVMPKDLKDHPLWWQGPSWLVKNISDWPNQPRNQYETDLERRNVIRTMVVKKQMEDEYMEKILKKFSCLFKLQRRTAFILRFKNYKEKTKNENPSASELSLSLKAWIKYVQANSFMDEVKCCANNDELQPKSKLMSLRPFLDTDGILRVGGRLRKSNLSHNSKHPIILPKRNHLTKLIIEQAHQLTLHGGPSLMSAFLNKYWIFGKTEQIKRLIKGCMKCFPHNCKTQEQVMADLPKDRVIQHRAFLHSGVDFAGPIQTKSFIGRSRGKYANLDTKSYICIFVCLSTKAIHIEFVSDYTSQAFIGAFKRFVAIRGKISDLYSDCGTNFVGANRIMRGHIEKLRKDPLVQNYIANDGTNWHFNPPASPHFGGLWESGVKSIKYHLKRLVGDNKFTFEEMTTILRQIEACLNSRPLCPMSDDIHDNSYLTPGHFIIGEPLITTPEPNLLDVKLNRLSRWQLVQRIYQQFWRHWSNEYLTKLQTRSKWASAKENVKVGQLVLYKEDNLPPSNWPIARILEIHPGDDNGVRVVTLKTPHTTLKRPIKKISVLPIIDNQI